MTGIWNLMYYWLTDKAHTHKWYSFLDASVSCLCFQKGIKFLLIPFISIETMAFVWKLFDSHGFTRCSPSLFLTPFEYLSVQFGSCLSVAFMFPAIYLVLGLICFSNFKSVIIVFWRNFAVWFLSTILAIIFSDILMFDKIFVSPQLKRIVIISNKHGIYELPNDLRLRTLGN